MRFRHLVQKFEITGCQETMNINIGFGKIGFELFWSWRGILF